MPSAADFLTGWTAAQDRQQQQAVAVAQQIAEQHRNEMQQQAYDLRKQGQTFDQGMDTKRFDQSVKDKEADRTSREEIQRLKNESTDAKTEAYRANAVGREYEKLFVEGGKLGYSPDQFFQAYQNIKSRYGDGGNLQQQPKPDAPLSDQAHIDAAIQKSMAALYQITPGMFANLGGTPSLAPQLQAPAVGSMLPPQMPAPPPSNLSATASPLGMAPKVASHIGLEGARRDYLLGKNARETEFLPYKETESNWRVMMMNAGMNLKDAQAGKAIAETDKVRELIKNMPLTRDALLATIEKTKALTNKLNAETGTVRQLQQIRRDARSLALRSGAVIDTNGHIVQDPYLEGVQGNAEEWQKEHWKVYQLSRKTAKELRETEGELEKAKSTQSLFQKFAETEKDPAKVAQYKASADGLTGTIEHLSDMASAFEISLSDVNEQAAYYEDKLNRAGVPTLHARPKPRPSYSEQVFGSGNGVAAPVPGISPAPQPVPSQIGGVPYPGQGDASPKMEVHPSWGPFATQYSKKKQETATKKKTAPKVFDSRGKRLQ